MLDLILSAISLLTKNKCSYDEPEKLVTFHSDVSFLSMISYFGKKGMLVQVKKPNQVVKLGRDFIYKCCYKDFELLVRVDKRGFVDSLQIVDEK